MDFAEFDRRPIIVAVAGPNGAGKSTFMRPTSKRRGCGSSIQMFWHGNTILIPIMLQAYRRR